MNGSHPVGQVVNRRRPRILVVQSGIERQDTLDVLRDLAPDRVVPVNDVFEAVTKVGLATARDRVETVVVPITLPDFSASRIVEAFDLCDRQVRLVLLTPNGRGDAIRQALEAGFDDAVEVPASPSRLRRAIGIENGMVPDRPVEIERSFDPLDRHESSGSDGGADAVSSPTTDPEFPAGRERTTTPHVATAAPARDVAPTDDPDLDPKPAEPLGDIHLVAEVIANGGNLRALTLALIRSHLGTEDVHLLLADESMGEDGRAAAAVTAGGVHLGRLVSSTIDAPELARWAEWLAVWMGLDTHVRGLERLTETDELTGAGNRRAFERVLAETLHAAGHERRLVTLMVFDIDNFKTYNDRYGHEAGDQVLRETVDLLRSTIRRGDHVFRIGGDEFVVIFSDNEGPRTERSAPPESVEAIAYRFQEKVCELRFPQLGLDADGSLSISAGLATFPWDGLDGATLLRKADELALESKRSGKNALRFGPGARSRCPRTGADDRKA